MSTYVASTQAFINLFETNIISLASLEEVYQKIGDLQSDEDIANTIEAWLESQSDSQLLQAYDDQLDQLIEISPPNSQESTTTLGPGNAKSPTPPGKPDPTCRELIENIIVKNKPLLKDSSNQPKPNS
ncbi:MAG: hypothetical protein F6K41_12625 [Symploca sp. SIO3E6]|nr:hypothetical protein [Caldora sp. SIO3E6]